MKSRMVKKILQFKTIVKKILQELLFKTVTFFWRISGAVNFYDNKPLFSY